MNLELLRTFLAVTQDNSFIAASKSRNMTQSTISHQIRRLEESMNQKLLIRTTRACRTTEEGEILKLYADRIVALADEMEARFQSDPLNGNVRISACEDFVVQFFSPVIARFFKVQPKVNLDIHVGLSANISKDLALGNIDLAVITQIPPTGDGISLYQEPLIWVASEDFQMPESGEVPLALVPEPCLYRREALKALNSAGIPWKIILSCYSHDVNVSAVLSGSAVSLLGKKDLRPGMKILREKDGFPKLPMSEKSLHQASNLTSEAAFSLTRTIINAATDK